jgi:sorting nexin-13
LLQAAILFGLFCVGFVLVAVHHGAQHSNQLLLLVGGRHPVKSNTQLGKLSGQYDKMPQQLRMDKRLTGATMIDLPMQEILDLMFRDCVEWWYYDLIGTNPLFLYELRKVAQHVVIAFANKSKDVDWVPFFTQRLVDDFAMHLRLYRAAQEKVKKKQCNVSETICNMDGIVDVVDAFFEMESELDTCRSFKDICTSTKKEQEYLRDMSEILLYLLLPPDDFHSKPLRLLAREVFVSRGLLPTIEAICDPDYVNQTIEWLCYNWAFTPEAFIDIVRWSSDVAEVTEVEKIVDETVSQLRAKDRAVGDSSVKQELSSLKYVKRTCCSRQEQLLCETDRNPDHSEQVIPFSLVLKSNSNLALFSDWIKTDTEGMQYFWFWENIEGFRVAAEQMQAACDEALRMGISLPDTKSILAGARCLYDQYLADDV